MHRFYISPENWNADKLVLEADEAHHALDVLRMRQGDRAVVFNGRGAEATVEFSSVGKKRVELRRIHHAQTPKLRAQITLAQASRQNTEHFVAEVLDGEPVFPDVGLAREAVAVARAAEQAAEEGARVSLRR